MGSNQGIKKRIPVKYFCALFRKLENFQELVTIFGHLLTDEYIYSSFEPKR